MTAPSISTSEFQSAYPNAPLWRCEAWNEFHKSGLPHRKTPGWKYVQFRNPHLSSILKSSFTIQPLRGNTVPHAVNPFGADVVVSPGSILHIPELTPRLVTEPMWSFQDFCSKKLSGAIPYSAYLALQDALQPQVFQLRLPEGHSRPIHIHVTAPTELWTQWEIIAPKHTTHRLVFTFEGQPTSYSQIGIRILVETQSHCIVEFESSFGQGEWYVPMQAKVQKEATLEFGFRHSAEDNTNSKSAAIPSGMGRPPNVQVKFDTHIQLIDSKAKAVLYALYEPRTQSHIDHRFLVEHCVGNTHSEQVYRGVIDNSASASFQGRVVIHTGADHSEVAQECRNLLLGERSQIALQPELEIYADEVKASHGATAGQLREEELFYLQSRGFNANEATQLLQKAFSEELNQRFQVIPLLKTRG